MVLWALAVAAFRSFACVALNKAVRPCLAHCAGCSANLCHAVPSQTSCTTESLSSRVWAHLSDSRYICIALESSATSDHKISGAVRSNAPKYLNLAICSMSSGSSHARKHRMSSREGARNEREKEPEMNAVASLHIDSRVTQSKPDLP